MDSILIPVAHTRTTRSPAPLRRAMPAGNAPSSPMRTALLALAGVVVFVDLEFALAYLLYVAVRMAG
jgi:hypothetical protein